MNAPPVLELERVARRFGKRLVVQNISFKIHEGEILCLLGPSGSGKSTLLRIIAGILPPSAGYVRIHGKDQAAVPTFRRDLGFVFQSPTALFPHLNVSQNVAFPFRRGIRRPLNGEKWHQAVNRMLQITGLQAHAESSIATLSGGELQRVALARALAYKPSLLLLDEPLSSLDNVLKPQLLDLILTLQAEFRTSVLYVTHDEREALQAGTHIAIIDEREIQQHGTVDEVARRPCSARVARIIGGWNILPGHFVVGPPPRIELVNHVHFEHVVPAAMDGALVEVGVPVENSLLITDLAQAGAAVNPTPALPVRVLRRSPWYGGWRYECAMLTNQADASLGRRVQCLSGSGIDLAEGSSGYVLFPKEAIHVFQ